MLIELVVYGRTYDPSLRAGIKHQKTMTELLDTAQPSKEAIEAIRKATVNEQTHMLDEAKGKQAESTAKVAQYDAATDPEQQFQEAAASVSTLSVTSESGNLFQKFVSMARRKLAANIVMSPDL